MKKILKTLGIMILTIIVWFIISIFNEELNHSNSIVSNFIFILEMLFLIVYPGYVIIRTIVFKSSNQYVHSYIFRTLLPFIAGGAAIIGFIVFVSVGLYNTAMGFLLGGIFIMGVFIVRGSKKQKRETVEIECKIASGELSERESNEIETIKGKGRVILAVLTLILLTIKLIRLF